jgi:hypothetical protein
VRQLRLLRSKSLWRAIANTALRNNSEFLSLAELTQRDVKEILPEKKANAS